MGNSMTDLDKKFGTERIIDTPVAESACTGAAVGASLAGMRPIVVHPRMDFMLFAIDPIVNQAAKWYYMFDGKKSIFYIKHKLASIKLTAQKKMNSTSSLLFEGKEPNTMLVR